MSLLIPRDDYEEYSVFTPENLLREARRQKNLCLLDVPAHCVLDPDGDLVTYLLKRRLATRHPGWACYHTTLYTFTHQGVPFGIVGCAVGASFAVLVAEELFASGCRLVISITSAGIITAPPEQTRFVLIEKSIRDEGTSYHYLPPDQVASIRPDLLEQLLLSYPTWLLPVTLGTSWTTDAPFRETSVAIARAQSKQATCVEMESAALYAFAQARNKAVICYAHLTNTMAQTAGDFEKGEEMGSLDMLELLYYTATGLSV